MLKVGSGDIDRHIAQVSTLRMDPGDGKRTNDMLDVWCNPPQRRLIKTIVYPRFVRMHRTNTAERVKARYEMSRTLIRQLTRAIKRTKDEKEATKIRLDCKFFEQQMERLEPIYRAFKDTGRLA